MIRVRFAPSPTGYLHVGGARTALFNWLFARRHKGTFVLRIEDTDTERSSWEMVSGIVDGLRWLGLDWDEGPDAAARTSRTFSRSVSRLTAVAAAQLVAEGRAYTATARLRSFSRSATDESGVDVRSHVLATLAPAEIGACERRTPRAPFGSACRMVRRLSTISCTAPSRSTTRTSRISSSCVRTAQPTYHLSVVADDIDMEITHVVRGDDHISNTPKQVLLYTALGRTPPQFAHVPLILGPDKKRLSKRHGATSVTEYQRLGYLPEAMVNFLALLGWSPGGDREVLSRRRADRGVLARGHQRRQRRLQSGKAGLVQPAAHRRLPPLELLGRVKGRLARRGLVARRRSRPTRLRGSPGSSLFCSRGSRTSISSSTSFGRFLSTCPTSTRRRAGNIS